MIKYVFPNARSDPKRRLNVSLRVEKYRDWIGNFDGVEIPGNFLVENNTLVVPPGDIYTQEDNKPRDYFYSLHTEYVRGYKADKTNIPVKNPKSKNKIPILDWYNRSWIDGVMYPSISNAVMGIGVNPHIIEIHPPNKTKAEVIEDIDKFIVGINYLREKLMANNLGPKLFFIENRAPENQFLISDLDSLVTFKDSRQDKIDISLTLDFGQLFSVEAKTFQNPNDEVLDILKRLEKNNLHEIIKGFHFYGITKSSTERWRAHAAPVGASGDIDWRPIMNWIYEHYKGKEECYILYEVFHAKHARASYDHLNHLERNADDDKNF